MGQGQLNRGRPVNGIRLLGFKRVGSALYHAAVHTDSKSIERKISDGCLVADACRDTERILAGGQEGELTPNGLVQAQIALNRLRDNWREQKPPMTCANRLSALWTAFR